MPKELTEIAPAGVDRHDDFLERGWPPFSLARFLLCGALSEGGVRVGHHIDPLHVRRGPGVVVVVPVPPFVRRGLRVTRWRILPSLLPAERRDVEVADRKSTR